MKRKINSLLHPRPKRPPTYIEAHWGRGPKDVHTAAVSEPSDNRKLIALGAVHTIVYVTRKGEDQDFVEYEHKFKPSDPPLLCYGSEDGRLYLVGGVYYMHKHGIVD
jgi:hypothetical protein